MDEANGMIAQQDADIQKLLDFIAQLQAKIDFDEASEPKAENNADEEGAEEASQEEKKEESVNMDSIDAYISQKIELIRLGDKLHMDGIGRKESHYQKGEPEYSPGWKGQGLHRRHVRHY